MLTFDTDGMVQQEFPFPAPIMDYIYKNLTASQLFKLYQTCKFFYAKFRLNIIEHFEISEYKESEHLVGNSLAIWHRNPAWLKLKNLWISNSFIFVNYNGTLNLDHSKFSRLTFNKIRFNGNNISLKDYEFLVKCPTLRHLVITGKVLPFYQEKTLSFEECIERAPHVSAISIYLEGEFTFATPVDIAKLISLERQTKLFSFHLYNVLKIPDPLLVIEFFKKHAISNVDYFFEFHPDDVDYDIENVKRFYKTVDDGLQAWKKSLAIPPTLSSSFIDLTGKIALITGAGEGIGRATVKLFRQLGASVIAIARNQYLLNDLVDECQNIINSGFLHTSSNDTSDDYDTEKLVENFIYKSISKIDVLVIIVDTLQWYRVQETEAQQIYRDRHYILESQLNLIQETKQYFTEAKGTIINVSTSHGLITKPENAASISNLERDLKIAKLELAKSGVRINSVNPGSPPTILPRSDGMTDITYKKYLQQSKKSHEEQTANAVAFLASNAAKLIDGAVLPVNALNLR